MHYRFSHALRQNIPLIVLCCLGVISILLTRDNHLYQRPFFKQLYNFISYFNEAITNIKAYPSLKFQNQLLLQENMLLRHKLINRPSNQNSITNKYKITNSYKLISAKVVKNSIIKSKNYIIINKGRRDGIKSNMGVINKKSIIGRVKFVSENFSSVISILHTDMMTPAKIKKLNVIGSLIWDGRDPRRAQLLYIPKYAKLHKGQEIITSAYDTIFPEGIPIGKIIAIKNNPNELFYNITVSLCNDFSVLDNIYIVDNLNKQEIDCLHQKTVSFYE